MQAGGDHLNDGVRRLLSEAGLQDAAIKALRAHAAGDERALTAVCFAIAMILRGGEKWRESVKWAAARNALLSSITKAERVRAPACILAQLLRSFSAMRGRDLACCVVSCFGLQDLLCIPGPVQQSRLESAFLAMCEVSTSHAAGGGGSPRRSSASDLAQASQRSCEAATSHHARLQQNFADPVLYAGPAPLCRACISRTKPDYLRCSSSAYHRSCVCTGGNDKHWKLSVVQQPGRVAVVTHIVRLWWCLRRFCLCSRTGCAAGRCECLPTTRCQRCWRSWCSIWSQSRRQSKGGAMRCGRGRC